MDGNPTTEAATPTDHERVRAPSGRDMALVVVGGLILPMIAIAVFLVLVAALDGGAAMAAWAIPAGMPIMGAGLWWAVHRRLGWGWRECGFVRPRRSLWHLWWEIPTVMMASGAAAAGLGAAFGVTAPGESRSSTSLAPVEGATLLSVAIVTSAVLLVPLGEEIIFRGVLYRWLSGRLSSTVTILATGALFGVVHVLPAAMLYIVPWGIAITALRAWHGTIWASYIAHAVNNAVVTLVTVLAMTS